MVIRLLIPRESARGLARCSHNFHDPQDEFIGITFMSRTPESRFDEHFVAHDTIELHNLGVTMGIDRETDLFYIDYTEYLTELPERLKPLVKLARVELMRPNSAPTQARAGFYRWPDLDAQATVEHVFPARLGQTEVSTPFYVQNIKVSGPSIEDTTRLNSDLSRGLCEEYLVHAWE